MLLVSKHFSKVWNFGISRGVMSSHGDKASLLLHFCQIRLKLGLLRSSWGAASHTRLYSTYAVYTVVIRFRLEIRCQSLWHLGFAFLYDSWCFCVPIRINLRCLSHWFLKAWRHVLMHSHYRLYLLINRSWIFLLKHPLDFMLPAIDISILRVH